MRSILDTNVFISGIFFTGPLSQILRAWKKHRSIKQAGKIRRGEMKASRVHEFVPANIKAIRSQLHKSQSEFAMMIGVSVSGGRP